MEESLPDGGVPDWFANPLGRHGGNVAARKWWEISDFGAGDIKGLWELSRMGWVVPLAAASLAGHSGAAEQLNSWLADWCLENPPYRGPNWKCGQEASIRVMHLQAAALILKEERQPTTPLLTLIRQHLMRIAPTLSYAIGQANNHGTSEAAALFIGGSFLEASGDARGSLWAQTGREWLEERALSLIGDQGSFSQYSVNYHRLMLDTYSIAELWRRRLALRPFSGQLTTRLLNATRWLHSLVDARTGDVPNVGASDGARLFPVTPTGYRDFRPSVQLAAALFQSRRAYNAARCDDVLTWFDLPVPGGTMPVPRGRSYDDGGWHVMRTERALAVLRYPRYRHRPSQADALHLDLTVDGTNLLRDAGTYSYNAPSIPGADFAGTAFHNTVTFDELDQMPRVSRFLYGRWLKASDVEPVKANAGSMNSAAAYRDYRGNRHRREAILYENELVVRDHISGPFKRAALRWRLPLGNWALDGSRLSGPGLMLEIDADCDDMDCRLVDGHEARNYARCGTVAVLEASVTRPCVLVTRASF